MPVAAVTLAAAGPLPGAVSDCIAAAACAIAPDSSFELGGILAYEFTSPDGAGYLLRYPVLPPSQAHDSQRSTDNSEEPPLVRQIESRTDLEGSIWLGARARYASSAASHELLLYVDQVQPAAQALLPRFGLNQSQPSVLHFALDGDALQAAQAYRRLALDPLMVIDEGILQSAEPLLPCVADGCSVTQRLALIGFGYVAQGEDLVLRFVPQDPRQALYGEEIAYDHPDNGFRWQRDYFVQTVPLPASGGLGLLGAAILAALARRSRRQADRVTAPARPAFRIDHKESRS